MLSFGNIRSERVNRQNDRRWWGSNLCFFWTENGCLRLFEESNCKCQNKNVGIKSDQILEHENLQTLDWLKCSVINVFVTCIFYEQYHVTSSIVLSWWFILLIIFFDFTFEESTEISSALSRYGVRRVFGCLGYSSRNTFDLILLSPYSLQSRWYWWD